MTKEEIQRVLDLSLEYYKSEVFGTDKESEKPSRERIDWIYDKMTGSSEIPNDLEEASSKFATHTAPNGVSVEFLEEKLSFQEGAKWDREQMMKEAVEGKVAESIRGKLFIRCPVPKTMNIDFCDKVRIIIVKED